MKLSKEKQRRFERLDLVMTEYNAAFERGEDPPLPYYDPEEWIEFQIWRQDRLERRARALGLID